MFTHPDHGFRPALAHDFTGETLGGRYHLDHRLGYGGTASIYAATCKNTGAIFALKVQHPDYEDDPVAVQRFKQEAQLAAQLRHPNLIPAYDAGWLGGRRFIAMELVEGTTLTKVLKEGPIAWERSTTIVCDLLAGLAALHDRGVAHRDISPNNCILEHVGGHERARLSDLGYARVLEDMSEAEGLKLGIPPESTPTIIYGTSNFIAPERLRGSPGDFRADIFSMGALWYSMLTGDALADPRNADPVAIAQRLELPPALRAVLLGALEIRVRRHHSAASMAGAIHKALADVHARRQRTRRLGRFAPLLSLLAFPAWFATRSEPVEPICVDPPTIAAVPEARELAASTPDSARLAVAATTIPDPSVVVAEEPPASPELPATLHDPGRPTVPAPPPRFNLRRALAKCKPHPTARMEVTINPGERVLIDGDSPTGELGRCVEDVLTAHPPQRAETIKL